MDWRTRKQLTIVAIVFGVVAVFIIGISYYILYRPGSCIDNKKNQGEEDVDCGGPCLPCAFKYQQPVEVFYARFIQVRPKNYDIVAEVQNPNDHLAANPLVYRVQLFDDAGAEVGRRENVTYLYPNDRIYIIESNFLTERTVVKAVATVLDRESTWQFTNDLRPELTLGDKSYAVQSIDNIPTGHVSAELVNREVYGYQNVDLHVALLDANQNILAIAKSTLLKVAAGERRRVEFTWPTAFATSSVARIDMEARANGLLGANLLAP